MMSNPWHTLVWPKATMPDTRGFARGEIQLVTMPDTRGFARGEIQLVTMPSNPYPKTNFALYFLETHRAAESNKKS